MKIPSDAGGSRVNPSTPPTRQADPGAAADVSADAPGRKRFWQPLRLWLLLGLLTMAALLPLLTLAGYTMFARVQDERAAEQARLTELAADHARAVDRELRGHIETAMVLSGSRYLQDGDIRAFWQHAEDAAKRADGHFILIDETYHQVVNTRLEIGSPLPRTADPAGVDKVLESGGVVVGDLIVGAVSQQQLFSVRLPVQVGSESRYVLYYVPRADALHAVVREAYRPEGWLAAVADGNGLIVSRSHRVEDFFGTLAPAQIRSRIGLGSGIVEMVDLEGRPALAAYHSSALSNFIIFVWAPRSLLEEPVRRARNDVLLLMALALGASLLAAYFASRLIREPNARLVDAARDLGEGRTVRFEPSVMKEANVVGEALAEAAQTIRAREAALRESEANMQIVMREVSHRSKNLLAIIQALVSQSARLSPDFQHFQTRFEERLAGLAHSHDLLVQEEWTSVPLDELLKTQLNPFTDALDRRVSITGPQLLLKPQAAQTLGMAFHELATNAMKYGALSVPSGRVIVAWERWIDGQGRERVRLRWEEIDGPSPGAPVRKGFGTMVVAKITPASLHGEVRIEWRHEGLVWELDAPFSQLV